MKIGSGAHTAPYPAGYCGLFSRVQSGSGVKLSTHIYSVTKLRILGAISKFPLYVFMTRCLNDHRTALEIYKYNNSTVFVLSYDPPKLTE
jgi:hypothetical protein